MTNTRFLPLLAILFISVSVGCKARNPSTEELFPGHMIQPAQLAKMMTTDSAHVPLILNIGPRKNIPGAVKLGAAEEPEGMANLKARLATLPLDAPVIIYCGCCPYEHCPNVRPAAELLKGMKFTHYQFLDLPHNIDKDWVGKGFPMATY